MKEYANCIIIDVKGIQVSVDQTMHSLTDGSLSCIFYCWKFPQHGYSALKIESTIRNGQSKLGENDQM